MLCVQVPVDTHKKFKAYAKERDFSMKFFVIQDIERRLAEVDEPQIVTITDLSNGNNREIDVKNIANYSALLKNANDAAINIDAMPNSRITEFKL